MKTSELTTVNEKTVRISLTQVNKNGKQNASFVFNAKGAQFNDFINDTCTKIIKVMELQAQAKANGGKSNVFGLTKSGEFELGITTMTDDGVNKLLNNFVFNLRQLGDENPQAVLVAMVEGYKLLTE